MCEDSIHYWVPQYEGMDIMLSGAISMNPNNFRGCSGIKPYLFFLIGLNPILDVHAIALLDVRNDPLCVCSAEQVNS